MRGLPLLLLIACASLQAGELRGRVVAVTDGDTLAVLDAGRREHRIRLAGIDAPENGQPYGRRAKLSLSSLCFGRHAVVRETGRDHYGRAIGRVRCDGIDASAEQVRRGMAWVYDRYATDPALYAIQEKARTERRGLWGDHNPIPPWEWRRGR